MYDHLKKEINGLVELGESRLKFINKMHDYFVSLNRPINILETGCGSMANNGTFACNTYVFSKIIKSIKGGSLTTVDINPDHLTRCKEITKDFSDIIDYKLGDSVQVLRNLNENFVKSLDLIILDSYDLDLFNPDPSAIHHLQELLSLYIKINKANCFIAIDDNYFPGSWIKWHWCDGRIEIFETKDKFIGKGIFCNDFLSKNDWIIDDSLFSAGHNVFLYKHKSNFQSHF